MKKQIANHLQEFKLAIFTSGRMKKDIANEMGIVPGHLTNMLNGRDKMTDKKRKRLNEILKTNI